jgi:hypothetical protein
VQKRIDALPLGRRPALPSLSIQMGMMPKATHAGLVVHLLHDSVGDFDGKENRGHLPVGERFDFGQ